MFRMPLGSTGLDCSPLGFGSYRIHLGDDEHEAALRDYLARGGNVIDTSANYGDGLSESLIGRVLPDVPRNEVILVTKGGYIQGRNMELARQRDFPEVVRYQEGLWHCIHPEFLQTQIDRSLERMNVPHVDVYLLHNPEYFLSQRQHLRAITEDDHQEFYRRIGQAFRFLESQVASGRIGWYGVSSNNFGLPESDPAMTSVRRCLAEAEGVSRDHHFRVVQLPMNLYEPGGAIVANNAGETVLGYCAARNIGVLVNRPLNAFAGGGLIRLADFVRPGRDAPGIQELRSELAPLREHERRLVLELQAPLMQGAGLAGHLERLVPQLESSGHWEAVAGPNVIRPLQMWLQDRERDFGKDMRWQAWRQDLIFLLNRLLERISRIVSARGQKQSDSVRARLYVAGYPRTEITLSRMALNVLVNLPGMGCVLNGMRRREYVEDAMGVPGLPAVDGPGILRRFQAVTGATG
jgi:aryl-alcohol dehydrogenase-like predicted oxidoreductase